MARELMCHGMAARNLLRSKVRSLFTIAAIALAIAAWVGLTRVARGALSQFEQLGSSLRGDVTVIRRGAMDPLLSEIDYTLVNTLQALPEVREAAPLGHYISRAAPNPRDPARLFVLFAFPAQSSLARRHRLIEGRCFREGKSEIILGERSAALLGVRIGQLFRLNEELVFKVVGIYRTGIHVADAGGAISIKDYFSLRGTNKVNAILLFLTKGRSGLTDALDRLRHFPDLEGIDSEGLLDHLEYVSLIKAFVRAVSVIAGVIAVVGVLNAMMTAVHERRREIGILSAIGWPPGMIIRMVIGEGLALAAVGGAIGTTLGLLGTDILLKTINLGLVETGPLVPLILRAFAVSLLVGILGAVLPAWKALSITPQEALRYE
jgi:putative ABC transport system permease protein